MSHVLLALGLNHAQIACDMRYANIANTSARIVQLAGNATGNPRYWPLQRRSSVNSRMGEVDMRHLFSLCCTLISPKVYYFAP